MPSVLWARELMLPRAAALGHKVTRSPGRDGNDDYGFCRTQFYDETSVGRQRLLWQSRPTDGVVIACLFSNRLRCSRYV